MALKREKSIFDKLTGKILSEPLEIRFARKLVICKETGCFNWTSTNNRGRAQIRVDNKYKYASRVAYEFYYGAIPKGLLVLHSCDNGLCVNPLHLFIGSHRDNIMDAIAKGRFKHMENIKLANNIDRKQSQESIDKRLLTQKINKLNKTLKAV